MTPHSHTSTVELSTARERRRLVFVSYMGGVRPGDTTTQGLVLSNLFRRAGYPVEICSAYQSRPLRMLDIVATLLRRLSQTDLLVIDVYGELSFIGEDVASWLGRRFGTKIIMCLRGGAMPEFIAGFPRWTRRVFSSANAIVTPSPFLARAVGRHGFRARVIPNVIDLDNYRFAQRRRLRPRLFWMRAFHQIYHPEMAVRVLARVRAVHPDATLVLGGRDKGCRHEIERLVAEMGLGDAVSFPGFLDKAGKERAGSDADIFVNTSDTDNMPVAIVEACAMGLPVVTTAVGGIPDLLTDGDTGLLVPDGDEQAMAEAVLRLLADEELAARLCSGGRALAERSSSRRILPQWEELFDRVMNTEDQL